MKPRSLRLLPFLLLLSCLPSCVWGEANEYHEAVHATGEMRPEIGKGADRRGVLVTGDQEEKRQFNRLWRQLSHEEQEALRRQMREAWQRLPLEERQRALVIVVERAEERRVREARENKGEKHHGIRAGDERGQGRQQQRADVVHKAYWESLSTEERAALRGNLREILRRRCQDQGVEGRGPGTGTTCGKAINR